MAYLVDSIRDLAKDSSLNASDGAEVDRILRQLQTDRMLDQLNVSSLYGMPILHTAVLHGNEDLVRKLLNTGAMDVESTLDVSRRGASPRELAPIQMAAELAVPQGSETQKKINIIAMLEEAGSSAPWEHIVGPRVRDEVVAMRGEIAVPVAEEVAEVMGPSVAAPASVAALKKLRRMSSSSSSDGYGRRSRRKRKKKKRTRRHRRRHRRSTGRNKRKSRKYH